MCWPNCGSLENFQTPGMVMQSFRYSVVHTRTEKRTATILDQCDKSFLQNFSRFELFSMTPSLLLWRILIRDSKLSLSVSNLMVQPLNPSYSAIGHRFTISPFIFQVSHSIALYPPPPPAKSLYRGRRGEEGGGIAAQAALWRVSRCGEVSQL